MATKDKTQGHGFVYVNVKTLLNSVEEIRSNPHIHPQEKSALTFGPLRPSELPPIEEFHTSDLLTTPEYVPPSDRFLKIKENLDRLQTLHAKLHEILAELNKKK